MTSEGPLAGRRVLVVGASSGIGRATAQGAVRAGGRVVFAARRVERLDEAVAQVAPPGRPVVSAVAVAVDVTDPDQVQRLVATTVEHLGGIDIVVYATAATHLADIESVDIRTWHHLFATNAFGLSSVLAAAREPLRDGWGRVVVLSSDAVGHPFPGLGAYVASKAALESVAESWRVEHPELDLAVVTVGPTATEAASAWDPEVTSRFFQRWLEDGDVRADLEPATTESVGTALVDLLGAEPLPARVDLAPPRPWVVDGSGG